PRPEASAQGPRGGGVEGPRKRQGQGTRGQGWLLVFPRPLHPSAPAEKRSDRVPTTVVSAEPIQGQIKREVAIVSSLGAPAVGNYVLVRSADEMGRIGLGEASVTSVWSGETQVGAVALIREVLAPIVVGADPFDSEWIFRRMEKAAFGNSFARAALEMALLD